MEEKSMVEKRKHERITCQMLINYGTEDSFKSDYIANISGGGIFIQTTSPIKLGSKIMLRLAFPNIPRLIEVEGKVVWINEYIEGGTSTPGMGIQFMNLSDEDQTFVMNFIHNEKKEGDIENGESEK